MQPLITLERQELHKRPRFAEPPRPGIDGLTTTLHNEPTEQPDLHDHPLIERSGADNGTVIGPRCRTCRTSRACFRTYLASGREIVCDVP